LFRKPWNWPDGCHLHEFFS